MKKSRKQSKTAPDKKTYTEKTAVKWFALMGYNKDNEDETGMLGIDLEAKKPYKIVHDMNEALKFPSENVNNVKGFGTPDQWLKFFNSEPDLDNWKFHLVKVLSS